MQPQREASYPVLTSPGCRIVPASWPATGNALSGGCGLCLRTGDLPGLPKVFVTLCRTWC